MSERPVTIREHVHEALVAARPCGLSMGALQLETLPLSAAAIRWLRGRSVPRGSSSPSRKARPSNPPKRARSSVERLARTSRTSIPPEMASQARPPRFGAISTSASESAVPQ